MLYAARTVYIGVRMGAGRIRHSRIAGIAVKPLILNIPVRVVAVGTLGVAVGKVAFTQT